jgi:hypothetical protein
VALFGAALAGCFVVAKGDTTVDADFTVSVALENSGAGCSGTQTHGDTVTVYSAVAGGKRCRADITWRGVLIDGKAIRADLEKQVDGYGTVTTVKPTGLKLQVAAAYLRDRNGADVTPPVTPLFDAVVGSGGNKLFAIQGTDLPSLLAQVQDVDAQVLVDPLDQAIANSTPIPADLTAAIEFDMADYLRVKATPNLTLHIEGSATINVHWDRKAF